MVFTLANLINLGIRVSFAFGFAGLPKIEAAIAYLEKNPAGRVLITSLGTVTEALKGKNGTVITPPPVCRQWRPSRSLRKRPAGHGSVR